MSAFTRKMEMPAVSYLTLRRLILDHDQKAEQFREELLAGGERNRRDLDELRASRQKLAAAHNKPWLMTQAQTAPDRVNDASWEAYIHKHISPLKSVTLPPDSEVDLDLLSAQLLNPRQPMLPAPERKCAQGFFPSFRKVIASGARPRTLIWGALIPNTILISLLWATGTLNDSLTARRRWNRLILHEAFDDSGNESDANVCGELRRRRGRRYRRGAFGDVSDTGFSALEDGNEWVVNWETIQPLRTRRRQRHRRPRSRRRHTRAVSAFEATTERSAVSTLSNIKTRESSMPSCRQLEDSGAESKRRHSNSLASRRSGRNGVGGKETHTTTSHRSDKLSSTVESISGRTSLFSKRPVFQRIVGNTREEIRTSMFTGESYDEEQKRIASYMRGVRGNAWIQSLVPDIACSDITPWQLTELIVDKFPHNNPALFNKAVAEVTKIVDAFSCKYPLSLKRKMLALLEDNFMQSGALESIVLLLERSLHASVDELVPVLLSLYPLCPEPSRRVIDSYLSRAGLRDRMRRLRHHLLTWTGPGHTVRLSGGNRAAMMRKVEHFLSEWRTALETNSKLLLAELEKKRLQAQVTVNIVSALAKYEPNIIRMEGDELCLELAKRPPADFSSTATAIDILNYFVEMSEPAAEDARLDRDQPTCWSRRQRRADKELIVAPRSGRQLRGDVPLVAAVQVPTSLVTHAPHGLKPLPWPALTVRLSLRLAAKYLFHQPGEQDGDNATLGAVNLEAD